MEKLEALGVNVPSSSAHQRILPSVSIIMPWFNTPIGYVERALNSVVQQDYQGPIELSICDDSSDPNMMNELEALLLDRCWRNINWRIFHHSDTLGASAARNSAVRNSGGEWLIWLDADDELHPSAIGQMMNLATTCSTSLVIAQCLVIEGNRQDIRTPEVYLSLANTYRGTIFDPLAQVIFSIQPQLMRRTAFEELDGFDTKYKWAEVTELFLRFVRNYSLSNIVMLDRCLYYYYRRSGSQSSHREAMELSRIAAMTAYASGMAISIQELRYIGRCVSTGAQHYVPIVNGDTVVPPYVRSIDESSIYIEISP